jgi:hypothetical protein
MIFSFGVRYGFISGGRCEWVGSLGGVLRGVLRILDSDPSGGGLQISKRQGDIGAAEGIASEGKSRALWALDLEIHQMRIILIYCRARIMK